MSSDTEETGTIRKNDAAWTRLISECDILDTVTRDGIAPVTAEQMKSIGKREPRLMAKIENRDSMPSILRKNRLCVLPVKSRGNYAIGHFDAFLDTDYTDITVERLAVNRKFEMLDPFSIHKEPSVILTAFNYGILSKIVGQEVAMTNFGRESSDSFSYSIDDLDDSTTHVLEVDGSQMEMDGVFESEDCIINIEAKMGIRDSFLARQLYYPYRMMEKRCSKHIINVFMTYTPGSIYLHTYDVSDPFRYNSFVETGRYRFDLYDHVNPNDILAAVKNTNPAPEPNLPFPQADSMQKVFESLEIMSSQPGITDADLAYRLSVDVRQGGYYGNACGYLGLSYRVREGGRIVNRLTDDGLKMMTLDMQDRILLMTKLMAKRGIFHRFIPEVIETGTLPEKPEIAEWIRNNISSMDPDKGTPDRRAGTIRTWLAWILKECNNQ